jgi:hypothetical protein
VVVRLGPRARPFGTRAEPGAQLGRVLAHHEIDAPVYAARVAAERESHQELTR